MPKLPANSTGGARGSYDGSVSFMNRTTIVLDREIEVELRKIQADMLMNTDRKVSFSHVINQLLKESLKVRSAVPLKITSNF